MNCAHLRDQLPALLYGDLPPEEAASLRAHLQTCPACQREEAALQQVRRLLDTVPVPEVPADLPRLYRLAAERHQLRARRWRRVAVVVCGAAAVIVAFVLVPRFELRLEAHQVVLRWAELPAAPAPEVQAPADHRPESRPALSMLEQVQVLSELVSGQREEMARLQDRVEDLQRQLAAGTQRWLTTERDVAALSSTQPTLIQKGNIHD